jgi:hypothetical protein
MGRSMRRLFSHCGLCLGQGAFRRARVGRVRSLVFLNSLLG